jgi:chemotaxis protein CheC
MNSQADAEPDAAEPNPAMNELQRDALQEVMNISMGQAANALALLIDIQVTLSIPKIAITTPQGLDSFYQQANDHYFARQSFMGDLRGEVISMISHQGCAQLGESMAYEQPMDDNSYDELVLELSNILAGACLKGMVEQLSTRLHLSAPALFKPELRQDHYSWQHALLLEISFTIEQVAFSSKVMICLDEKSIRDLQQRIDILLS